MTPRPLSFATLRIRITRGEDIAIGQGKADLLEAIQATGSISAAGRKLGMSYRKAWLLVSEMNRCFRVPLVEAAKGGVKGGGAHLTETGLEALSRYRELQRLAWEALDAPLRRFAKLLAPGQE